MRIKNYKAAAADRFDLVDAQGLGIKPSELSEMFHNENNIERWITYNIIIEDIMEMDYHYRKELKERLSSDENINEILLTIINTSKETKQMIGYHKAILKGYLDEDLLKEFI